MSRGQGFSKLQGKVLSLSKKSLKNFQKPLDKQYKVWYNIVTERGKATRKKGSPREQVRPFRQRLSAARCVGLRDINVSQSPQAEKMLGLCLLQKPLLCDNSSMVERLLSKRGMWVRFPLVAPKNKKILDKSLKVCYNIIVPRGTEN